MGNSKDKTFVFQLDELTQELMHRACIFTGLDQDSFIQQSICEKAEAIIAEFDKTTFTEEDWHRFFDMIDNPPQPTERMKKSVIAEKMISN